MHMQLANIYKSEGNEMSGFGMGSSTSSLRVQQMVLQRQKEFQIEERSESSCDPDGDGVLRIKPKERVFKTKEDIERYIRK